MPERPGVRGQWLAALAHDLRAGDPAALLRAARRVYGLTLGLLVIPGLAVGLVLAWTAPGALAWPAVLGLLALALALAGLSLHLARRAATRPDQPPTQAALTGAIQAASAPGVIALLGCTLLAQPGAALVFGALALGAHAFVWQALPGWVRAPTPAAEPTVESGRQQEQPS